MKNPSVLCFGELLVDMISMTAGNLSKSEGFLKKFGGAPANTAIGLAKLKTSVSFVGKVGNDPFGHFLKNTLKQNGVDISHLILTDKYHTTLAFVSLGKNGERDFTFYKGAHEQIFKEEVDIYKSIKVFHFGSLTQITEPAITATNKLISKAQKMGIIISYDPNIRPSLWVDLKRAKKTILETIQKVDILKLNSEEAGFLSDHKNIEEAAKKLYSPNLEVIIITLGKDGCFYKTAKLSGFIPTISVKPVDTTGAGDAFNAGYLNLIVKSGKNLSEMSRNEIEQGLKKANIISSLTTLKKGAITAFPTEPELTKTIKKYL